MKKARDLRNIRTASIVLAAAVVLAQVVGCSHRSATPPPAAPVSAANNPPAGAPNHMSPEMQAQIEHYKSLASGAH
jgi:hypothetical protein